MSALDTATRCIRMGWAPLPVPHRSKKPDIPDWPSLRITDADVRQHFNGRPQNIGVILGQASNGLSDVDLDCPESIRLAPLLLPRTRCIFGRRSKLASHWFYRTNLADTTDRAVLRFAHPTTKEVLVELRIGGSSGAQTIVPGSTHESGEPIEWALGGDGEPATVDGAALKTRVAAIAVGSLLVRHWPGEGSRHEFGLVLGGFLARAGWTPDDASSFVEAVATAAADPEEKDRAKAARDAAEAYRTGRTAYGLRMLREAVGEPVARCIADWLGYREGDKAEAPKDAEEEETESKPEVNTNVPMTVAEWLARDLPEPDFLMGEVVSTTSRGLLVAPTGLGKTMFSLALAAHMSVGRDFLHWRAKRAARVLYIDGEMSRRLLKQRLADVVKRLGVTPETLFVLSHEDIAGFAPLNTEEGQKQIEAFIAQRGGVDFINFDNIMSLVGGDQKDEEGWRQTLPWVRDLTRRGIGQLWIHHTGHDETRSYGTKTREWQLDTVLHLERVERPDTDVSFTLSFRKARERTPDNRADFQDVTAALVHDRWEHSGTAPTANKRPLSPMARKFFDAFTNSPAKPFNGRPSVTTKDWQAECVVIGLIDKSAREDSARALFSKYRRELVAAGYVACEGDLTWRL